MTTENFTIANDQFAFSLDVAQVAQRTDRFAHVWQVGAKHYQCSLVRWSHDEVYHFFYSQGSEIKGAPNAASVFYSVLSDAVAGSMDFTDFCAEFGYSMDAPIALEEWRDLGSPRINFETFCDRNYSPQEVAARLTYEACEGAAVALQNMGIEGEELDHLYALASVLEEDSRARPFADQSRVAGWLTVESI